MSRVTKLEYQISHTYEQPSILKTSHNTDPYMGTKEYFLASEEFSCEEEKEDANAAQNVGEALLDNLRPVSKHLQNRLIQSAQKSPQIVIKDGPGRDLPPTHIRAPSTTNMPVDLFR